MSRREVHANDHLSALASWLDLSLLLYFSLKFYISLDFKSLGLNLSTGKKFLLNHEINFFSFKSCLFAIVWSEWKMSGDYFFLITHISCPFNFLPLDDYDDFLFCLFKSKKYMDNFRAFFINSLYVSVNIKTLLKLSFRAFFINIVNSLYDIDI